MLRIEHALQPARPVERIVWRLPHPVTPSMTVPYETLQVVSHSRRDGWTPSPCSTHAIRYIVDRGKPP
jgi:hypothetical protein